MPGNLGGRVQQVDGASGDSDDEPWLASVVR